LPGLGADPHPHLKCRGPRKSRARRLLTLRAFVAYEKGEKLPAHFMFLSFNAHSDIIFGMFISAVSIRFFLSLSVSLTECHCVNLKLNTISNTAESFVF